MDISDTLNDLEDIYAMAMAKGNYTVALKAKELLGKEQGLFSSHKKASLQRDRISLADFSEEDINHLIGEIERRLTLDP